MEDCLMMHNLAAPGDKILIMGGLPLKQTGSTNLLKIHTIGHP
ncbi:MAG: hypothetical protein AAFQ89_02995 [Cyanobacteria bacterium J06626_18]